MAESQVEEGSFASDWVAPDFQNCGAWVSFRLDQIESTSQGAFGQASCDRQWVMELVLDSVDNYKMCFFFVLLAKTWTECSLRQRHSQVRTSGVK